MGKIIWHVFGPRCDAPNSFEDALEGCNKLPSTLKERLIESWTRFGERINDYRNCVEHYVPLHQGFPSANMSRLEKGIWSTTLLIPDNPEGRSQKNFQFYSKIDALTYGWELTNEITEVTYLIVDEVRKVAASR